ncbi:MAG: L-seryl-tRNA(Sec) selenium transferase [Chloroflexi bacterium]|nr:L-seryl-tRNA(Sec) selenium transferase [Chloroflexota bacterium]
MQQPLRGLPSVDRVLSDPQVRVALASLRRDIVVDMVRQRLDRARQEMVAGGAPPAFENLVGLVLADLALLSRPSLRPVINATGVVLHTNLGRAPLSQEAAAAAQDAALRYSNLEFELDSGERGSRLSHIETLLCRLTGAEAALVVNNNASAVLLGLTALAQGWEVVVSRSQAVEIGGGFRIPDVLRQSGAQLVEVGTTNRTYLADYEAAITGQTAALLRVHPSNFKIVGFTESVPLEQMVRLAHERHLIVLDDLGSGCLLDTAAYGLDHEPMVQESVAAGADLIFFSGDKLLGGPQAGLVVGRADLVRRLRRHPLARAVRIDKMSLAALAVTLLHYLRGEALSAIPIWRMIARPLASLEEQARGWAARLGAEATVVEGESYVGGGSLPGSTLPTRLVAVAPRVPAGGSSGAAAQHLAARLRLGDPPIVARIERDRLLLDPRTVLPDEETPLLNRLSEALHATPA